MLGPVILGNDIKKVSLTVLKSIVRLLVAKVAALLFHVSMDRNCVQIGVLRFFENTKTFFNAAF